MLYRQIRSVKGEASCIQGLGDIALECSDRDGARARYEQALRLYARVGDVLGEAGCIQGLGDIALECSDRDDARARYEQALQLYQSTGDSYSAGWVLVRLARLDPPGQERADRWRSACRAWTLIGRDDLIESVESEFQ
jgi:tetratricopeptide (TPR) repeat protein